MRPDEIRDTILKAREQQESLEKERQLPHRGGKHAEDSRIPAEIAGTLWNLGRVKTFLEKSIEASQKHIAECRTSISAIDGISKDLKFELKIACNLEDE